MFSRDLHQAGMEGRRPSKYKEIIPVKKSLTCCFFCCFLFGSVSGVYCNVALALFLHFFKIKTSHNNLLPPMLPEMNGELPNPHQQFETCFFLSETLGAC